MIRVVHLRTTDEVIVPVRPDGAFDAELFAPPGSSLQINTSTAVLEDLPPHFREMVTSDGLLRPSEMPQGRDDPYTGQPIRYPLDPYLPLVSRADRPQPIIRHPPSAVLAY